jgi:CheY-like chemotaxis protein
MNRRTISVFLLLLMAIPSAAQEDFYLPYNRLPETTLEHWAVVKYEVGLGNYRRAKDRLKAFWDKLVAEPDADRFLVSLYEKEGLGYFVRLSNIAELRELTAKDPDSDKEQAVVDLLLQRVSRAMAARSRDPDRVRFFVKRLAGPVEERAYAIDQLRRAGPLAVPAILEAYRDPQADAKAREPFATALLKLHADAGPPILACLDSSDAQLQMLALDWFLGRADERVLPYLWYLQASPEALPAVRQRALEALVRFTRTPASELRDARLMCLKEAEKWYKGEVQPPPGGQYLVWVWDDRQGPVAQRFDAPQAREYWTRYWARKALDLDPVYEPAQVLLLSALLERAYEQGAVEKGLEQVAPALHGLLAETRPQLLERILERACSENRTLVALAAVRALQPAGDWRLVRGTGQTLPPLVRALSYPDRRVQMAAAEAILNIPQSEGFPGANRVVEVLRLAVAGNGPPRALLGFADDTAGRRFGELVQQLGYAATYASSGRRVLQLAAELGDVELIVLDANLPEVGGVNATMAQLRGSPNTAGIPILLLPEPEQQRAMQAIAQRYPRVLVLSHPPVSLEMLREQSRPLLEDRQRLPLSDAERSQHALKALDWLRRMAAGEVAGFDMRPAEPAVIRALGDDQLAIAAAAVLAHRSGKTAQQALADLVLSDGRGEAVRAAAAHHLRRSIQRHGVLLKQEQLARLPQLATTAQEAALREEAARLINLLQPDPAADGARLRSLPTRMPREAGEAGNGRE